IPVLFFVIICNLFRNRHLHETTSLSPFLSCQFSDTSSLFAPAAEPSSLLFLRFTLLHGRPLWLRMRIYKPAHWRIMQFSCLRQRGAARLHKYSIYFQCTGTNGSDTVLCSGKYFLA